MLKSQKGVVAHSIYIYKLKNQGQLVNTHRRMRCLLAAGLYLDCLVSSFLSGSSSAKAKILFNIDGCEHSATSLVKQAWPLSWNEACLKEYPSITVIWNPKMEVWKILFLFTVPKSVLVFRGVFQKRHHFTPLLSSDVENFVNGDIYNTPLLKKASKRWVFQKHI